VVKITRHILRTRNGLEFEIFFDEETGVHDIYPLGGMPSEQEMKRDFSELLQWHLGILREWERRTGKHPDGWVL
jgi:hypothetical protein